MKWLALSMCSPAASRPESGLSEAATTTPESTPSFGAEKATPLPLPCLDPGCLDASLLSLQPGLPAASAADSPAASATVAANFFNGLRTAVLVSTIAYEWSMPDCAGGADADSHLAAAQAAELLTAELRALTALRCVSELPRDECPVCMEPYDEGPGCYPSARATGAFECEHSLCFGCSRRLLVTAAAAGAERASLVFRCPLCRADGCLDRADVPTPAWLLSQQADPEVVSARAAAAAREDEQAPLRLRLATSSAADQIAALRQLITGDSAPGDSDISAPGQSDIHRLLALLAVRGPVEGPEEEAVTEAAETEAAARVTAARAMAATMAREAAGSTVEDEVEVEEEAGGGRSAPEARPEEEGGEAAGVTAARGDVASRC